MAMTVGDLKKRLQGMDNSLQVVLSADAEGNSYSPLTVTLVGNYQAATTWHGEFTPGSSGELEGPVNALCLVPMN